MLQPGPGQPWHVGHGGSEWFVLHLPRLGGPGVESGRACSENVGSLYAKLESDSAKRNARSGCFLRDQKALDRRQALVVEIEGTWSNFRVWTPMETMNRTSWEESVRLRSIVRSAPAAFFNRSTQADELANRRRTAPDPSTLRH